jgi:hypothetical protein
MLYEIHNKENEHNTMAIFEDDNIISWNFANWITVVLMAAIAFFLLGLLQKYMQGKGKASNAGA